ncbi:beta-galactosidase [Bailinhaonella thermotolerans]|uniref:beta-galactosidase n=1 Tax=Bailinhaonella thermotolerans TaxID=1070861 RepID=UPI001F5BDFF0|nr:beta-galactosidase [Bailinhaonella thermotolerans]
MLTYGGDYNPEQWPEETWREDVRLMRQAGVNLVNVGVFAWGVLEPAEGRYDFGWLDRVIALLHENGVGVDLATPTAAPPPWFARAHPRALPVTREGHTLWPGGRQAFCPSSPDYRAAALRVTGELARRYGGHPAVKLWHVHNEYGNHNTWCYCDTSAEAFRAWLRERYGGLDGLNAAWGTAFWSQRYGDWAEVLPPRLVPALPNPTQLLDWQRFSDQAHLANFRAERDLIRSVAPGTPITTNLMAMSWIRHLDTWRWAQELDVAANDHYIRSDDPEWYVELAMSGDLIRSSRGGAPWMLMETAPSAVNWQPRNRAKAPGELRRAVLGHVARGADGVSFFQWRASAFGSEKFHSGMVPHAGPGTKVFREVCRIGRDLRALAEVAGARAEPAEVAILWDQDAWWALELDSRPTVDLRYYETVRAWYTALHRDGVPVDFASPAGDLSGRRLVLAPSLYLVTDEAAAGIARHAASGGHVVIGPFSGVADENDHVRLGGYPGAFRDLLGVWTEEFFPLQEGERVTVEGLGGASVWTEHVHLRGAEAVARYADGPLPGLPAVTRHGTAWYVATVLDEEPLAALLRTVRAAAGVTPPPALPRGVEAVRRGRHLFVLNHTAHPAPAPARGLDLLTGLPAAPTIPPGGAAVIRLPR